MKTNLSNDQWGKGGRTRSAMKLASTSSTNPGISGLWHSVRVSDTPLCLNSDVTIKKHPPLAASPRTLWAKPLCAYSTSPRSWVCVTMENKSSHVWGVLAWLWNPLESAAQISLMTDYITKPWGDKPWGNKAPCGSGLWFYLIAVETGSCLAPRQLSRMSEYSQVQPHWQISSAGHIALRYSVNKQNISSPTAILSSFWHWSVEGVSEENFRRKWLLPTTTPRWSSSSVTKSNVPLSINFITWMFSQSWITGYTSPVKNNGSHAAGTQSQRPLKDRTAYRGMHCSVSVQSQLGRNPS